ncbi:MAG: hypothetical protein AB1757_01580 [Acidobacteriota bacterium]
MMCKKISTKKKIRRIKLTALTIEIVLLSGLLGWLMKIYAQDIAITADFADKPMVLKTEAISFRLNRPLTTAEGRLAVIIGKTDMTAFFVATEQRFTFTPKLVQLPVGENAITVYLVSATNEWKTIGQFTLKIAEPNQQTQLQPSAAPVETADAGQSANSKKKRFVEKVGITPALTVGIKSQLQEFHFPDTNAPARSQFTDFIIQGSFKSEMTNGETGYQSQFDVAGSSFQQEALRFAQLGNEAPRFDLASYLMQFNVGKMKAQVGHIAFGTNRHLINSFSSRGITLTIPITSKADFSVAAMNGSSIVGFANFLGLTNRKHQIITGTLGIELAPKRPGGFRVETGILHGSLLPVSNFNQGNVTDAEQSKGLSFRVIASDPAQRFKLDGGFARSRFTNPADNLLNQDRAVVPVQSTARNAEYIDASYAILQNRKLSESKQASLIFNLKHERVAPLFRSVATFTQADRLQNQYELVGTIGELNAVVTHQRFNDNLANIPSVLTTLTRRNALVIGMPLASFIGKPDKPSAWLPRLGYTFDRVQQFGGNSPISAGFDSPSQIPNQLSSNQNFTAEWQAKSLRFGYRFNRSFQDNRQPGRERADLKNLVNGFLLGLPSLGRVDLTFDLNFERATNVEANRTDRTLRLTSAINWRVTNSLTFTANISGSGAGDLAQTSRNRNAEFDLQMAYRFISEKSRYRKVQGQFFIRYANRYASAFDRVFGFNNLTKIETLNTGLSFTFF